MSWLKNLKAGDTVIVHSWTWSYSSYRVSKVEKVTPKGFIKVDGFLYYPEDGRIRGDSGSVLMNPSDESTQTAYKQYCKDVFVKKILYKMRAVTSITYEQACKIKEILDGG